MSEPQPIGTRQAESFGVREAIARASQRTGVDFQYLLAQAKLESSLDPSAKARTSSAAGLYQFTIGTWLQTLDRHGASHGLEWAGAAIDGRSVSNPQLRAQIMALRFDPNAAALMAAELANDNRAELAGLLGREPDATELYLAHFLGSTGASRFLTALAANPEQSAVALLPAAAAANRPVFYDTSGTPRSVGAVMEWIRGKVQTAMDDGESIRIVANPDQPASTRRIIPAGGPIAQEFPAVRQNALAPIRASMADTLRTTFAAADVERGTAAPGFVREAYGQFKRFGL